MSGYDDHDTYEHALALTVVARKEWSPVIGLFAIRKGDLGSERAYCCRGWTRLRVVAVRVVWRRAFCLNSRHCFEESHQVPISLAPVQLQRVCAARNGSAELSGLS
jgi:hypothetical protein